MMYQRAKGHLEKLQSIAVRLGEDVLSVCNYVFDNPKFIDWSGSSRPHQHHYGRGGLIEHTFEVVETSAALKNLYCQHTDIDDIELFFSCLFHDTGKMFDYEPVEPKPGQPEMTDWIGCSHKRLVHHISRSAIIWTEACLMHDSPIIYNRYHSRVLHAILAHHGTREAGSPVAPKSRVAWLLHFSDGISARMYDADTLDIVKREGPRG